MNVLGGLEDERLDETIEIIPRVTTLEPHRRQPLSVAQKELTWLYVQLRTLFVDFRSQRKSLGALCSEKASKHCIDTIRPRQGVEAM